MAGKITEFYERVLNLILVDDHKMVATGLARLLEARYRVTIACNLVEMQDYLATQKFDLALLDLQMGDGNHNKCYREVLKGEGVLILIVAATISDAELFDCYGKGVCGYAAKDSSEEDLVQIVSKAIAGEDHWSPELRQRLQAFTDSKPEIQKRFLPVIRQLLAPEPLADYQIAQAENLGMRTVNNYVHILLHLYHVSDRHQLIIKLRKMGYTPTFLPDLPD